MDQSKTHAWVSEQLRQGLSRFFPQVLINALCSFTGRFCVTFAVAAGIMAGLFGLIFITLVESGELQAGGPTTLWTLYVLLLIPLGIFTWRFLLSRDSRGVAQRATVHETQRLLRDIKAYEEADRALQAAKESAEAASYAKTRYLSGISHEFRTPLQSILGYAQLLKRDESDGAKRRAIEIIHRSGEHLADLVESLLDVSRIEAGRIELRSEVVSLPELLQQLVAIFQPMAAKKGVVFEIHLPSNLPSHIRTDPQRLRQILMNLLSNAVKFTESGTVNFSVGYGSQVAEFEVRDTGPGIAQADLQTIFRPFERGRASVELGAMGTGLGLTIVRLLCDVMGGDVTVDSVLGEGSTFKALLYLPPVEAPIGDEEVVRLPTGFAGEQRTVMVVDDDPVQRGLISDMLVPLGFLVLEARDASDCQRQLTEAPSLPDLLLMDVQMPGLSGLELARMLKVDYIGLPIVMVSANAEEPKPGTEDAYDHYLVKPIRIGTLMDQIADLLDLNWTYEAQNDVAELEEEIAATLLHHAELGHASGLRAAIETYLEAERMPVRLAEELLDYLDQIQFAKIVQRLRVKTL